VQRTNKKPIKTADNNVLQDIKKEPRKALLLKISEN
jgi:hypothetical protein